MRKGLAGGHEHRLAQLASDNVKVYIDWIDRGMDSGWAWGFDPDDLEFISYDLTDKYDPELDNMTAGYQVRDPNASEEDLKAFVKDDERFPQELRDSVVFDINIANAPDEHPWENGNDWNGPYDED